MFSWFSSTFLKIWWYGFFSFFWAGWGTDEKVVIKVLGQRNASQRRKITETYQQLYNESLFDSLRSELSGDFMVFGLFLFCLCWVMGFLDGTIYNKDVRLIECMWWEILWKLILKFWFGWFMGKFFYVGLDEIMNLSPFLCDYIVEFVEMCFLMRFPLLRWKKWLSMYLAWTRWLS